MRMRDLYLHQERSQMNQSATKAPEAKPNTGTAAAIEAPKSKRGGARKLAEGVTKVTFLMPTEEYDHLVKMADDDDRKAEDLARVLARGAVKSHKAKASAVQS